MNLIVNADKNWGIGKNNSLLIRIPEDMKFFRRMTKGNVIVLGRRTLESFPGGTALPDRTNIVLSKKKDLKTGGATVVNDIDALFEILKEYDDDEIFVVGGESVYRELLPYCRKAYVTRPDYAYDADAHFPNLDELENWVKTQESEEQTYFDIVYTFDVYENNDVKDYR